MEPVDHCVSLEIQLERKHLNGLLGRVRFQLVGLLQGLLLFWSQDNPWLLDLQEAEVLQLEARAGAFRAGIGRLAV